MKPIFNIKFASSLSISGSNPYPFNFAKSITLTANISPVVLLIHLCTLPNVPDPICSVSSYCKCC